MHGDTLESLLKKAKDLEKKYEWPQAADYYSKASDVALREKDITKAAELQEKIGYSFYRAALQAETNSQFKKRMKKSIQVYEKESRLLKEVSGTNQLRIDHANAMIALTKITLEIDPKKMKNYFDKWWNLENKVLSKYEQEGDLYSVAKTCNNLVLGSRVRLLIAQTFMERKEIFLECERLAEKAIKILCKIQDDYELARAYGNASWNYCISNWLWENENKVIELNQKSQK